MLVDLFSYSVDAKIYPYLLLYKRLRIGYLVTCRLLLQSDNRLRIHFFDFLRVRPERVEIEKRMLHLL